MREIITSVQLLTIVALPVLGFFRNLPKVREAAQRQDAAGRFYLYAKSARRFGLTLLLSSLVVFFATEILGLVSDVLFYLFPLAALALIIASQLAIDLSESLASSWPAEQGRGGIRKLLRRSAAQQLYKRLGRLRESRRGVHNLREELKLFVRHLVPREAGWSSGLRVQEERIASPKSFGLILTLTFAASFPLLVASGYIEYYRSDKYSRVILELTIGYNALTLGAALIAPLLAVMLITFTARSIGFLPFWPNPVSTLRRGATWVGGGTVLGVVAGFLFPLGYAYFPGGDSSVDLGEGAYEEFGELPSLLSALYVFPAQGALLGMLFGISAILSEFGSGFGNRLYAIIYGPALYVVMQIVQARFLFTPRSLFSSLGDANPLMPLVPDAVCMLQPYLYLYMEGSEWSTNSAFLMLSKCNPTVIVGPSTFWCIVYSVVSFALIIALSSELDSFWEAREREGAVDIHDVSMRES